MGNINDLMGKIADQTLLAESAAEVGKNLLRAMIDELVLIPHPSQANQNMWSSRKQAEQDKIIERFKKRVRAEVTRGYSEMLSAGNPAAQALLKDVKFSGKGITASLEIEKSCDQRHALADFADRNVAVIMPTDIEEYFTGMDDVTSESDQRQFDLDPGDGDAPDAETGGSPSMKDRADGPEPTDEDTELCLALNQNEISVGVEDVMLWSSDQIDAAWHWIDAFEADGESTSLPSFLEQYVTGDAAASPATGDDTGAEQPVPAKDPADMTKGELVEACRAAAVSIGEGEYTEKQMSRRNKTQLLDYLNYATEKYERDHDSDDADRPLQGTESDDDSQPSSPSSPSVLRELLGKVGIVADETTLENWSREDREACAQYAITMASGKLPTRIPDILGPFLMD